MASYIQNLRKIGEDAFRLIDQAEEKQRFLYPTKPTVHHLQPPQLSNVYRADPLPARSTQPPLGQNGYHHVQMNPAPVVDRDEPGGLMDCYEAARRYGGIVETDYYPKGRKIVMKRNNMAYQW